MLMARRRLIMLVAAATLALTAVALVLMPRTWTASADIYIDYKVENDPISGRSISALLDDSYMRTQVDMLQSQAVVKRMLENLGLWQAGPGDDALARQQLVDSVRRNLSVEKGLNSRVLTVSYSSGNPQQAQEFANALVNAYIQVNQNIVSHSARTRSEQYTAQLENLRNEIDAIQQKITRYQRETGLLDTKEYGNLETQRLNELTSTLVSVQSQLSEAQARNQTIDGLLAQGIRPEELPQMGTIAPIVDMHESLSIINRRLGEVQGTLGRNHPTVRGLLAERQQISSRIAHQAAAALNVQRNELQRLQAQEKSLQQDIEAQRAKVLEHMSQRDQLAAYQRQLAGVEQVYNAALQKYDSIFMAGNISLPDLAVLREAEVPNKPSSPRLRRTLMLALLVGLMGGAGLALLLELLRRRVRCLDDLTHSRLPAVIGRIGKPAHETMVAPL